MGSIIILCIIAAVVTAIFVIFKLRREEYTKFILKNSIALKELLDINNKFHFYDCNDYEEVHTYDNVTFYDNISCEDYLIYQLQFKKNDITSEITIANENKKKYDLYSKQVNAINTFGQFSEPATNYKSNYLYYLEEKIFNKNKLNPTTTFGVKVTLNCSKINGQIYESKSDFFSSKQIITLIKRLNNKNGNFYNDREIWDAICRVERGKVSNKMRFSIYKRDGYRCCRCGRSEYQDDLEIDHIKPISKGGKSTYENLQTLCSRCNKEKGNKY